MAKQSSDPTITNYPMPSARVPWLVIWALLAAIVLVFMGFLRGSDRLLGPPLPKNEYLRQMAAPKPAPAAPVTATPAANSAPLGNAPPPDAPAAAAPSGDAAPSAPTRPAASPAARPAHSAPPPAPRPANERERVVGQ